MNLSKSRLVSFGFPAMAVVALWGCASSGPKETSKLVWEVEDSRRALQVAEAQVRSTLETADALGQTERTKLQSDYQRFNNEIRLSEEKLEQFRKRFAAMNKASDSYFTTLAADLDKYETPEFRARSEAQLEETRARYNEVVTAMQQAQEKFHPFIAKLHDLSRYLNYNLNPTGVAAIKEDVQAINSEAPDLYTTVNSAVQEADMFVDRMAP